MRVRDGGREDVDGVARVWAARPPRRDGRAEHAGSGGPDRARHGERGAVRVVAAEQEIVGFATAIPTPRSAVADVDVRFVGGAPERWRSGLGAQLLRALRRDEHLRAVQLEDGSLRIDARRP